MLTAHLYPVLPQVNCADFIPSDLTVAVRERDTDVDGNVTPHELEVICKLVKLTDPEVLFEIGTFDGRTTLNLAGHSRPQARVFTLDLPRTDIRVAKLPLEAEDCKYIDKPESGTRFRRTDVEHKIVQLYGDSAQFDFTPYFGGVDFLFIDGSHSYHYVLNDSRNALQLLRGSGLILWHDYKRSKPCAPTTMAPDGWPGLVQALEELHATNPAFRDLKHIAGTKLAMLQISSPCSANRPRPWTTRWHRLLVERSWFWRRDSCQPAGLKADLQVRLSETRVKEGIAFAVHVTATNIGSASWLPSTSAKGPVRLGCHLFDQAGKQLYHDYAHYFVIPGAPVRPGQTLTCEIELPLLPKGRYFVEFDLVAEGVCWFACNGSKTVRAEVDVF